MSYVPTLVLGLGVMLCAVRAAEDPGRTLDWCALGLLAGAGWWTSTNIMYFVVPAALWVCCSECGSRSSTGACLATRTVRGPSRSWRAALDLEQRDVRARFADDSRGQAQGNYLDHLGYFFTHALPARAGDPRALHGRLDRRLRARCPLRSGVGALVAVGVARSPRAFPRGNRARALPFVFAVNPVASNLANDFIGNGRYFYFFTPFLALAVGRLVRPVAPALVMAMAPLDECLGVLRAAVRRS